MPLKSHISLRDQSWQTGAGVYNVLSANASKAQIPGTRAASLYSNPNCATKPRVQSRSFALFLPLFFNQQSESRLLFATKLTKFNKCH